MLLFLSEIKFEQQVCSHLGQSFYFIPNNFYIIGKYILDLSQEKIIETENISMVNGVYEYFFNEYPFRNGITKKKSEGPKYKNIKAFTKTLPSMVCDRSENLENIGGKNFTKFTLYGNLNNPFSKLFEFPFVIYHCMLSEDTHICSFDKKEILETFRHPLGGSGYKLSSGICIFNFFGTYFYYPETNEIERINQEYILINETRRENIVFMREGEEYFFYDILKRKKLGKIEKTKDERIATDGVVLIKLKSRRESDGMARNYAEIYLVE